MDNQINTLFELIVKHLADQVTVNIQNNLQLKTTPVPIATTQDIFFNIDELSKLIGLTKSTIYGHVHRNTIPYIKKGKMLRFSKHDILKWIEDGKNNSKSDLEAKANEYLAKNPLFNR